MKVYGRILEKRVRGQVTIDETQFCFMLGKGTIDAIIHCAPDARKVSCKDSAVHCFVDREKAFDRVPREVVRWALRMAGVEELLVQEAVIPLFAEAKTHIQHHAVSAIPLM